MLGTFDSGDIVLIATESGESLSVCVCNYSSIDLDKVKGLRSDQIANLGLAPNRVFDNDLSAYFKRVDSLSQYLEETG